MNQKKAKALRKQVGYNASQPTSLNEYHVTDTTEVIGYQVRGVNADGSPILQEVKSYKCTVKLDVNSKHKQYKLLKQASKNQ